MQSAAILPWEVLPWSELRARANCSCAMDILHILSGTFWEVYAPICSVSRPAPLHRSNKVLSLGHGHANRHDAGNGFG